MVKNPTQVYKGNNWRKKAQVSFEYCKTESKDWQIADVKDRFKDLETGEKYYTFVPTPDHEEKIPFSDSLTEEELSEKMQNGVINGGDNEKFGYDDNCELCGHPIKHPQKILHETKKFSMKVGSQCVKNYTNAEKIRNNINRQAMKILREQLRIWTPKFLQEMKNRRDFCKIGGSRFEPHKLHKRFYNFWIRLENRNLESIVDKQIKQIWRTAIRLGLTVPEDINDYLMGKKWYYGQENAT